MNKRTVFILLLFYVVTNKVIYAEPLRNAVIRLNDQYSLKMNIPNDWKTSLKPNALGYKLEIITHDLVVERNEKSVQQNRQIPSKPMKEWEDNRIKPVKFTVGVIANVTVQYNRQMTKQEFDNYCDVFAIPLNIKKEDYKEIKLNNGHGKYYIPKNDLKLPSPNSYKYTAYYYAIFNNGCLISANILTNDINDEDFQRMLKSVFTIELVDSPR